MPYNQNQARVPAGSAEGGEWTSEQLDTMVNSARQAAGLQKVPTIKELVAKYPEKTGYRFEKANYLGGNGIRVTRVFGFEGMQHANYLGTFSTMKEIEENIDAFENADGDN